MDFDSWNGHVGVKYDLSIAIRAVSFMYGPSMVLGVEHISSKGFFDGLEGGVLLANYTVDEPEDYRPKFYPLINFKLGRLLK